MLQVLDVVHVGRQNAHSGDSFRVIGKMRGSNEPVVIPFDDYLYQVFVAVGPNFTPSHVPLLANKLLGFARGQPVVKRAELVWGNDFGEGYQPSPKPFLRLEVSSVHFFERFDWQQFVQKTVRELSSPPAEVEGCYEISNRPIDLFLKQTGIHGLAWIDDSKKKVEVEEEDFEFSQCAIAVQSMVVNSQRVIVAISSRTKDSDKTCHFTWKPTSAFLEEGGDRLLAISVVRKTEAEMLQAFHYYIVNQENPDVIVVSDNSVLSLIKERTERNGLPKMEWSRIKELPMRFEEGEYGHPKGFQVEKLRVRCPGRVIVDLYSVMLGSSEGGETVIKGRGLDELAEFANVSPLRDQIEKEEDLCMLFYGGSPDECLQLVKHGHSQVLTIFEIMKEQATMETLFALCKVMRTIPTDQLDGTISQRVERMVKARSFPLMLLAKDKGDKWVDRTYEGGLILLPEPVLTSHPVFAFDVKSMYPSIICEGNMCLTTMLPDGTFVSKEKKRGLLPTILQELMDQRQEVKRQLKEAGENQALEGKQKALKIAANATYGTLALKYCTLSSIPLAESVCQKGRALISRMRDWVVSSPLLVDLKPTVVYVNTDCVFVECKGLDQSLSWDEKYQAYQRIHRLMEEEVMPSRQLRITLDDYVIDRMLLLAKNNYAFRVCYQGGGVKDHFKGLSCIRFNAFPFVSRAIKGLLGLILLGAKPPGMDRLCCRAIQRNESTCEIKFD